MSSRNLFILIVLYKEMVSKKGLIFLQGIIIIKGNPIRTKRKFALRTEKAVKA